MPEKVILNVCVT